MSSNQPVTVVEVAIFAPLQSCFTYLWSATLGEPLVAIRTLVPLGSSLRLGVVERISTMHQGEIEGYKEVADRLDVKPLLPSEYRVWSARMAAYYLALPGERWETALAWAADEGRRRFRVSDVDALATEMPAMWAAFGASRRIVTQATVRKRLACSGSYWQLRIAEQNGWVVEVVEEELSVAADTTANDQGRVILNPDQQQAVDALVEAQGGFLCHLLFGCTGSGKTEVYVRAAEQVIAAGGQVLVLVPEIGLTPMWLSRVTERLGSVGVWHSALKPRARHALRSRLDQVDAVVGTRSALFLPLPRLQFIIVDEEHDGSFKQHDGVPFSARDMAVLLGQQIGVPVVLGSATPSMESWHQAHSGRYRLLTLPNRVGGGGVVTTRVVDMRGSYDLLSPELLTALARTRDAGQQSILYLNRRGYSPALHCTACGAVPLCRNCTARMTLHRTRRELRCHLCSWQRRVPNRCDSCGEQALLPLGAGTERLVELLATELPQLRVARLDRDVVLSMEQHIETLDRFACGEVDCLIGTQMVVKGHHFPRVTLIGVVQADLGLNLPDVRAAERWWQQLTQVIGRAGRGSEVGETLLQSYQPDHPWLGQLGDGFASAILQQEMVMRQQMSAPPFSRWVRVVFSALSEERALEGARRLGEAAANMAGVQMSGPIPCAIERINRRFRFELLFRDESRKLLPWALKPVL
ncbi:MAG: primosomal protein N', partial [Mariprofundales bacterium]|nr:primosomal protein N' [Mariprofundales bacterium]